MKKLTDISKLKQGDKFYFISGIEVNRVYEFICIHPKSKHYIIALEGMMPVNLDTDIVLHTNKYYVGEYDIMEVNRIRLRELQEMVKSLSNMLLSEEHSS